MTDSTVTMITPDVRSASLIAQELVNLCVPGQIGREHVIFVAGTSHYCRDHMCDKRLRIRNCVRNAGMPYTLKFYTGYGMVCFWEFDEKDAEMTLQKDWYDKGALMGRFPQIRHTLSEEEKRYAESIG